MKSEQSTPRGFAGTFAWCIAVALVTPMIYVLSVGPVGKAFTTIACLKPYENEAKSVYYPLIELTDKWPPFQDFMLWYVIEVWHVSV